MDTRIPNIEEILLRSFNSGYKDTKYRGDYCLGPLIVDTRIPNIEEIIQNNPNIGKYTPSISIVNILFIFVQIVKHKITKVNGFYKKNIF